MLMRSFQVKPDAVQVALVVVNVTIDADNFPSLEINLMWLAIVVPITAKANIIKVNRVEMISITADDELFVVKNGSEI